MADFEYAEEEAPLSHHLVCCLCQSLAVQPVRLRHTLPADDCGTVTCLECFRRWARTASAHGGVFVDCPRCRRPCMQPCEADALPDCLLGRLVGHLAARCLHCAFAGKVEDMLGHMRGCMHRRLHGLRQSHRPETECNGTDEQCRGPHGCTWGDVVGLDLLPAIRADTERYVQEWIRPVFLRGGARTFSM